MFDHPFASGTMQSGAEILPSGKNGLYLRVILIVLAGGIGGGASIAFAHRLGKRLFPVGFSAMLFGRPWTARGVNSIHFQQECELHSLSDQ